jgi:hypothetical protein
VTYLLSNEHYEEHTREKEVDSEQMPEIDDGGRFLL